MNYRLTRIIEENPVSTDLVASRSTYTYVDQDGDELTTTELLVDEEDLRQLIATTRVEKHFSDGVIETVRNVAS